MRAMPTVESIFARRDDVALIEYLERVARVHGHNREQAFARAEAAIKYYEGGTKARSELAPQQHLERRWYDALAHGEIDYLVYSDDAFIAEAWACWAVYSRKYLLALAGELTAGHALAGFMPASVIDLGCGIGYTTAALKELFPAAAVVGTQLLGTFQFAVAEALGRERGFRVASAPDGPAELVFASEYFEHFQRPVTHLERVLAICQPRCLVIANAFGARSVGHFDHYIVEGGLMPITVANISIATFFNHALRDAGYERVKTSFWNDRPTVWMKR